MIIRKRQEMTKNSYRHSHTNRSSCLFIFSFCCQNEFVSGKNQNIACRNMHKRTHSIDVFSLIGESKFKSDHTINGKLHSYFGISVVKHVHAFENRVVFITTSLNSISEYCVSVFGWHHFHRNSNNSSQFRVKITRNVYHVDTLEPVRSFLCLPIHSISQCAFFFHFETVLLFVH